MTTASDLITVYSKPNCPSCTAAKKWLSDRKVDFKEVNVMEDADALVFLKAEGHKSVPQLYFDGKLLVAGGFDGLRAMGFTKLKSILED